MLSFEEQAQLAAAMCATAETLGQTLSANAAGLMAQDLADYTVTDIAAALQACRRELTGKLTLAAILQRVQAADGRPEPNEAWSLALAASNEFDSVVLTDEIQLALGAARAVLDAGDKIGARMAFLSAYQRFVDAARRDAKPVSWKLSPGFDPAGRLVAVEEAGRLGRLPEHVVREHVAQLTHQPITQDGRAIAALLTGNVVDMSAGLRSKWREVKDGIHSANMLREEIKKAELEAYAEDLERRKLAVQSMVAARITEVAHG
jgi:hypothetical protein